MQRIVQWATVVALGLVAAGCASVGTRSQAPSRTGPACPLTGRTPPGGGEVPKRPALAFKVDNYPTARPQSGLDRADIVFEEPVEGGITRYVAVFQCQQATRVGPVRSARNIDVGVLGQLGHPVIVHVGGITPVIDNINASPLVNVTLGQHAGIIYHPPTRVAPYSTYTSTADIWRLRPTTASAPHPLFAYSKVTPPGTAVSTVSIPFSGYSPVVWRYDARARLFERYYNSQPDMLADGPQNSATNVVVQFVHVTYGPWAENSEGGLEVQANLYRQASGKAEIFRDGREVVGRWSRNGLRQPTVLTTAGGASIKLAPGRTWIELVPTTIQVTTR